MKSKINRQEVIDWKVSQLVVSEQNMVVLSLHESGDGLFSGVIVSRPDGEFIGEYESDFTKSLFKRFTGEITLSND